MPSRDPSGWALHQQVPGGRGRCIWQAQGVCSTPCDCGAGHATAVKQRTLHPPDHPAQPRCQHFGPCGGCSLQSLQYAAQLQHKQQLVVAALRRIAKLPNAEQIALPIIPSRQQYGYRNKVSINAAS